MVTVTATETGVIIVKLIVNRRVAVIVKTVVIATVLVIVLGIVKIGVIMVVVVRAVVLVHSH